MEQYSNLNVHGKIKQKTAQGSESDDIVLYPTLTGAIGDVTTAIAGKADKDLENIEVAGTKADGKTIVWDATNEQWQYGEAGKVDDVKIGSNSIVANKIATIPAATSSALGVVQVGSGLSVSSGTVSQASVTRNDGTDSATLSAGGSFAVVSDVSSSTTGHVTGQTVKTYALPSTYAPSSHAHGNLTNDGKLGTTANKPVVTTTGGVITAGSVTSPIAMNGTSITHEASGAVSSGTLSKGSASKSVSVTVNQWGHVTALSDQDITIAESQVTNLSTDLSTITGNISTINGKIPSAASSSNQLADKAFVNSSIGTATANFLGTYNAVSDLGNSQATVDAWTGSDDTAAQALVAGQISSHLPSGTTVTNNDYVYIAVDQTPTGDAGEDWFWRYKYNGSAWAYEYTLNNSSFTADQWNTINSLVTNTSSPKVGVDVKDINAHLANSTIHVTASDKTTWNGKQNAITGAASTITSSNLTADRVLISNSNGKVAAATITATELGYLDNVTEDIQTQLDTKFDTIDQSSSGNYVSSVAVDGTDPSTIKVTRATLPTLSGGQAATTGKYVSGVTVSGHTVTVSQENLPTLSGGASASSGKYVSGVTVSGHAVTVTQENLPTLSGGAAAVSGKYVSGVTVSGHAVTVTQADLPTPTDNKVQQKGITSEGEYPILLKYNYGTSDVAANYVNFAKPDGAVPTIAPSTGVITAPGGFKGSLTGHVTGDVTGNVSGHLTGNVTGNCSGSAGSVAYSGITSNPFAATDVTLADM